MDGRRKWGLYRSSVARRTARGPDGDNKGLGCHCSSLYVDDKFGERLHTGGEIVFCRIVGRSLHVDHDTVVGSVVFRSEKKVHRSSQIINTGRWEESQSKVNMQK